MIKLGLSPLKQSLTSQTGFLLVSTIAGHAFSYLYLVVMGRALGPEAFGILGALVAIFLITCLIGQALMVAIGTRIAEIRAKSGDLVAAGAFVRLGTRLGLLSLVPSLAFVVASRPIASFFHLTSNGPVILLGFSLSTALILDVVMGLMQGRQEFRQLGITGYLAAQGLKPVLAVIFVWVGWDLLGAVGALLASTALAVGVGLLFIWKQLTGGAHSLARSDLKLTPVILPTLILAVFLSLPANVDVMLVTHFFGGKEAGLYTAAATVGKVIFFLPMAVSFILLPRVAESHALGKSTRSILLQSLALVLALSGSVALICTIFPEFVVDLFFGKAYDEAQTLIALYVSAMLVVALNTVLMHYSLAIRNLPLMIFADLVTLIEVGVISLAHQSLLQVIWILLWGNLLVLLIGLPYLLLRTTGPRGTDP